MKTVLTLLAVVLLSGVGLAVSAADVSGTWDLEMKWSGDAKSTGVCTFKQQGEKLSGTCGSPEKFPITGRVQNRQLSWQFDVSQEGNIGRMKFDGELDEQGTTIEGSCSVVDGQDGTFMMRRQKS
jgi:hypothetical protein